LFRQSYPVNITCKIPIGEPAFFIPELGLFARKVLKGVFKVNLFPSHNYVRSGWGWEDYNTPRNSDHRAS